VRGGKARVPRKSLRGGFARGRGERQLETERKGRIPREGTGKTNISMDSSNRLNQPALHHVVKSRFGAPPSSFPVPYVLTCSFAASLSASNSFNSGASICLTT
jgi:hypothetical protein